jgi:hypothetical protein
MITLGRTLIWRILLVSATALTLFGPRGALAKDRVSRGQILFADTFEVGRFSPQWSFGKSKAFTLNHDPLHSHSGSCSMEVTVLPGENAGGMGRIWFNPGFDKVHARWYVKFDSGFDQGNLMHLDRLGALRDRNAATAGRRPNGSDFFRTTLDLWRDWGRNPAPGEALFYSYFPLMKIDSKTGKYYGNFFKPRRKVLILPGRWYCMEMMLKANHAGRGDGEQAFWINGKLIGHFRNITWRFTNQLRINTFSLGLFIHENQKVNRIWYDDVVVSTGFVGP